MLSLKEYANLQYHDVLNPVLWADNNTLLPDVETKLKEIAKAFISSLKMNESLIKDIVLTGSSANYNYSKLSDLDIHIIADYNPDAKNSTGITNQTVFDTARNNFNFTHKIKVNGLPSEVYVQPDSAIFTSNAGVYSLRSNKWLKEPVNEHIVYNNAEIKAKARPLMMMIDNLVKSNSPDKNAIKEVKDKIWGMRASGMGANGNEFQIENIVFKSLRNEGYLKKLLDYEAKQNDKSLSL